MNRVGWSKGSRKEDAIVFRATLETAILFGSLALAVNLAVYGWLGVLGAWSDKGATGRERLVYLFIAGLFTVMAVGAWYTLAFGG